LPVSIFSVPAACLKIRRIFPTFQPFRPVVPNRTRSRVGAPHHFAPQTSNFRPGILSRNWSLKLPWCLDLGRLELSSELCRPCPSTTYAAFRPIPTLAGGGIHPAIPETQTHPSHKNIRRHNPKITQHGTRTTSPAHLLLPPAAICGNFCPLWMMQFRPPHRRRRHIHRRRRQSLSRRVKRVPPNGAGAG
jgi:hypothetical protein